MVIELTAADRPVGNYSAGIRCWLIANDPHQSLFQMRRGRSQISQGLTILHVWVAQQAKGREKAVRLRRFASNPSGDIGRSDSGIIQCSGKYSDAGSSTRTAPVASMSRSKVRHFPAHLADDVTLTILHQFPIIRQYLPISI